MSGPGLPTPQDIARAKGYIAFKTGRPCPYDHVTQAPLVDAFYVGMARAELDHAEWERTPAPVIGHTCGCCE
jgi:hypothetical protein